MMRTLRIVGLLVGLALSLGGLPRLAQAAPAAQTPALVNGGFEQFEPSGVATGWASWVVAGAPQYQQITSSTDTRRVKDGSSAQMITVSNANFQAGFQQTVFGVTPGQRYRFTIWAHAWASDGDDPAVSEYTDINLKIGIGQGETFAADPSIAWSGLANYVNTYQQLTVEAVAQGSVITVFTYANPAVFSKHNDVYWDSAALSAVGAPPAQNTQPPPAPTLGIAPTPFLTPTPNASGQIVYVVQPGDSLVRIATIACGETPECVERIKQLNGLSSNVISVGQSLIIGPLNGNTVVQPTAQPTSGVIQPTTDPNVGQPTTDPNAGQPTADPGATAAPVEPTAAPVEVLPSPTLSPALGEGAICITLYNDANGNGILDAGEALVAGGGFVLRDQSANAIGTYTTTGVNEPYCFEGLASGTYQIASEVPAEYVATTRTTWDLTLAAGSTANVEFGAQFLGEGAAPTPDAGTGNNSGLLTALLGAAGVIFLLLAAGVAGYLVLTRRAS